MPIQQWSDGILMVDLANEPDLSDELQTVLDRYEGGEKSDVVLNLAAVTQVNSSNISQFLRLRQIQTNGSRRLVFCSVRDQVWSVMITTGLDKIFEFCPDVPSALASLQLDE